jgi:hypothetical protein
MSVPFEFLLNRTLHPWSSLFRHSVEFIPLLQQYRSSEHSLEEVQGLQGHGLAPQSQRQLLFVQSSRVGCPSAFGFCSRSASSSDFVSCLHAMRLFRESGRIFGVLVF